jgi:peptidoglycan hydrolase-like protein with peptidoglycan-binding domain
MTNLSRRALLAGVTPTVLGAGVAVVGAPSASALPTIWMDRVVVQAQVEPWTNTNSTLPGDEGIRLIQQALRARVGGVVVDGHFGDQSRTAYAAWQRSLGYSGAGANGIPGPTSLTKLGAGRFEVARKIITGGKVTFSGVTVNERTRAMLVAVDGLVAWSLTS